jgi:hypothetical protein
MNLSIFIREHMEEIMKEWMIFAKKNAPSDGEMTELALKDHAQEILAAIAADIQTHQSSQQQFVKSQGDTDDSKGDSAASIHGALRHASNFSLLQLSSEFRALRATVLRLWLPTVQTMTQLHAYEMIRFNEAIDQALAESIVTYSEKADQTRDLFLAVLGHDLRAPLATVSSVGHILSQGKIPIEKLESLGQKAQRSAMLMSNMVTDLLGFARLQMGTGMPNDKAFINAQDICEAAASDAHAMYPNTEIEFQAAGNLMACFDSIRLQQLLTNLLINAAQYSAKNRNVIFQAQGTESNIVFKITNFGSVIPPESLKAIFQPLVQLKPENEQDSRPKTSLGLGLFIANEITKSHDGNIHVTSDQVNGTTFSLTFPRVTLTECEKSQQTT